LSCHFVLGRQWRRGTWQQFHEAEEVEKIEIVEEEKSKSRRVGRRRRYARLNGHG